MMMMNEMENLFCFRISLVFVIISQRKEKQTNADYIKRTWRLHRRRSLPMNHVLWRRNPIIRGIELLVEVMFPLHPANVHPWMPASSIPTKQNKACFVELYHKCHVFLHASVSDWILSYREQVRSSISPRRKKRRKPEEIRSNVIRYVSLH